MSENDFWRHIIRPNLISFGILHRIENSVGSDMPDVTYCLRRQRCDGPGVSGWFENKHVHEWPKRSDSKLRFKRFTVGQAEWLYEWSTIGGKAFVMCQVGTDYFLKDGIYAKELQHGMTRERIEKTAAVFSKRIFPTGRIVLCLTQR